MAMVDTRLADFDVAPDCTISISHINSSFPYKYISVDVDEYPSIYSTILPSRLFPELVFDGEAF